MISISEFIAIAIIGNNTTTTTPARTPEGDYALRLREPEPGFKLQGISVMPGEAPQRKMIREEILLMFSDTGAIDALIRQLQELKHFDPPRRV